MFNLKNILKTIIKNREIKKLAKQGCAKAQLNLGDMYSNGEGVEKNCKEAAKWYKKAADQGEVNAQFALAVMYYKGLGVQINHSEAVKWWKKAADQGHSGARYFLDKIKSQD